VKFFARGQPSTNDEWYGSKTWRDFMDVFAEMAADPNPVWHESMIDGPRCLATECQELRVGQVIEIESKGKRFVTSVTGSRGKFHAHFKNQKVVPLGHVRWRLLASAPPVETPIGELVDSAPRPTPPEEPRAGRKPVDDRPAASGEQKNTVTLWERMRRHPVVGALVFLGAVVAGLGSLTDSLDKLIQFLKKYFGT